MNYYVIVEGESTEKKNYKNWIEYINPKLNYKTNIDDMVENDFMICAGYGYPCYMQIIENAIYDVNDNCNIDKLVVCVDSEDSSFEDKYEEIDNFIKLKSLIKPYSIVIQHFCVETWLLANRKVHSKNISNPDLRKYIKLFNTHKNDPELLPCLPQEELNRSQFAYKYFRLLVKNKYHHLTYSKSNPSIVSDKSFYYQINKRFTTTDHIRSFQTLLNAFHS